MTFCTPFPLQHEILMIGYIQGHADAGPFTLLKLVYRFFQFLHILEVAVAAVAHSPMESMIESA